METTLDKRYTEIIIHMTGSKYPSPKRQWGWRNYFAAGVDSPDHKTLLEMESQGLVVAAKNAPCWQDSSLQYFYATEKGCLEAGLSKAATKRAMSKN